MQDGYDYIVVGAGPAGAAVARRLAEAPGRPAVAVIEAGGRTAPFLSDLPLGLAALVGKAGRWNYGFDTEPQPGLHGRRGYQPRGRGVGGSSLINAMICIRGQPQDYDGWARLGCTGWAWDDVLPFFRRSEDHVLGPSALHGAGGPLPVSNLRVDNPMTRAFVEAGVEYGLAFNGDFNGTTQEGVGPYHVFQRDGRRVNAGRAYLDGIPLPHNLDIIADCVATRILIEAGAATGVAVRRDGRETMLRARRQVVLSAGAFGSPQLLMVSGIGPGRTLARAGVSVVSDRAGVGRNLQDHLDYTTNRKMKAKGLVGATVPMLVRGAIDLMRWRMRGEGLFTSNAAEGGAFVRSAPGVDRPDLQIHFCIGLVDDHGRARHLGTGCAMHVCGLRPASRGHVAIANGDVSTAPVIDPCFLSAPEDMEVLLAGAKIVRQIFATAPLSNFASRPLHGSGGEDDDALRGMIRERADTIYHPVGTCRMGADEQAVVDPRLRVRGMDRLRVADASIMPTLVSGNTQAPSTMIGERAAALILEDER